MDSGLAQERDGMHFPTTTTIRPPPKSSLQRGLDIPPAERWGLLRLSGVSVGM